MSDVNPTEVLRQDAIEIWRAGVAAVDAERLVTGNVHVDGAALSVSGHSLTCKDFGRVLVVGAGKAGAAMAAGFERAVGPKFLQERVTGWVNVPEDCLRPLQAIHLHPARPAGVNEPTEAGVIGADRILSLVSELDRRDVCVVLLSGGGSALLPAPVSSITLADKQALTRGLMRAGATINELNCVRKQLSRIKGGRLAEACRAGLLITLIISDVIGDPLDVIASGPTVPDTSTPAQALAILDKYASRLRNVSLGVRQWLESRDSEKTSAADSPWLPTVHNHVIGNIGVALKAAAEEARQRGYDVEEQGGANAGVAREVGRQLADHCLHLREAQAGPICVLNGGEPVVHLVPTDQFRSGGRNQELALAAARRWWDEEVTGLLLLSGGTDGEDGPTDAAGAFVDTTVIEEARRQQLSPDEFLAINNSYPFFDATGGLLKTGPTHTNVMDLRVGLVRS